MKSTIRRRIAVVSAVFGALSASASTVYAQSSTSGGGWGFEGRAGSSTSAFIVRNFNSNWSGLLGGNFDFSQQERESPKVKGTNVNIVGSFILRRAWGAGPVRPFIGFGPMVGRNTSESTSGSPEVKSKTTSLNIGGRGELGGMVPVTSVLSFGVLMNVNVNRQSMKTTVTNSNIENKTTGMQSSIGGLQFLASLKF